MASLTQNAALATVASMGNRRWIVLAVAPLAACVTAAAPAPTLQGQAAPLPRAPAAPAQLTAAPPPRGEVVRTTLQTIAILVAVTVFLTREALEAQRRTKSRRRKVAAIKTVLARACELNHWTIKSLRREFASMPTDDEPDFEGIPVSEFSVSFRRDGRAFLVEKQDGKVGGSGPLLEARLEDLKAALLDVAELEPNLLPALDDAITGLEEVNHVRSSLIGYLSKEDEFDVRYPGFFPGFVDYAREEIEDAFKALDALYRACTGNNLTEHRVR